MTQARFLAALETARSQLPGLVPTLVTYVGNCLQIYTQLRQRLAAVAGPAAGQRAPKPGTATTRLNDLSKLTLPLTKPVLGSPVGTTTASPAQHWLVTELESLMPPRFLDFLPYTLFPALQFVDAGPGGAAGIGGFLNLSGTPARSLLGTRTLLSRT